MRKRFKILFLTLVFVFGLIIMAGIYTTTENQIRQEVWEDYKAQLIQQIENDEIPIHTVTDIVTGEAEPGSVVTVSGRIISRDGDYASMVQSGLTSMRSYFFNVHNMPTGTGYYPGDGISFYGLYQERQSDGDIVIWYLTR